MGLRIEGSFCLPGSLGCRILYGAVFFLSLMLTRVVSAQEVVLRDDLAAGAPLEIWCVVDAKTSTFGRNILFTLVGTDAKELLLRSSDLTLPGAAAPVIDRSNISIPAGTNLMDGISRDVRVNIANVSLPGEYSGTLTFTAVPPAGKARIPDLVVPLKLHVAIRPVVRPSAAGSPPAFSIHRVHWEPGAWILSEWLLPPQLHGNTRSILIENQTITAVKVLDVSVTIYGDKISSSAASFVVPKFPATLAANSTQSIALTFDRDHMLPDHYHGAVRLMLDNADEPVVIPFSLDVRNGPKFALLVIILGVIVGRLIRNPKLNGAAPPAPVPALHAAPPPASQSRSTRAATRTFALLAGSTPTVVEQGRWFNALSFTLLLILLVLTGLQSLYVTGGATFGAGGLFDYVGFFMWGLSADIAQRTLQNLPLH